jgi:hypothetical protein
MRVRRSAFDEDYKDDEDDEDNDALSNQIQKEEK